MLALIIIAAAIYVTAGSPKQVPVYVAARDIPAYHHITADDVTLSTRDADDNAKYVTSPIDGRLSLKPLAKDKPFSANDIAPDVAKILGDDLAVHGFDVAPSAVLGGVLRPGDRITILLLDKSGKRLARLDAVVLSTAGTDSAATRTLVVALRAKDAATNEIAIATGTATVSKDPAAEDAPN
ncbi:SAF domain-containing protein [Actinoplanes sp. NPDC049596]|uniref:SAF domain-containing protein n=1 Tax=Actinoplanes sp. NPDC049596 TaxID=3154625 RepID=UPI0034344609